MRNNNTKFINTVVLFVFMSLLLACQQQEQSVEKKLFFSIEDYFTEQIQILEQGNYSLEKSIDINDRKEVKQLKKVDYQMELASFIDNDINRPAWSDKYSVDSLLETGQLKMIAYQALDNSLQVQNVTIYYTEKKEVEHISITSESDSVLSNSKKEMDYYPLKHYHILSVETTKTGDVIKVEIDGRFIVE